MAYIHATLTVKMSLSSVLETSCHENGIFGQRAGGPVDGYLVSIPMRHSLPIKLIGSMFGRKSPRKNMRLIAEMQHGNDRMLQINAKHWNGPTFGPYQSCKKMSRAVTNAMYANTPKKTRFRSRE